MSIRIVKACLQKRLIGKSGYNNSTCPVATAGHSGFLLPYSFGIRMRLIINEPESAYKNTSGCSAKPAI